MQNRVQDTHREMLERLSHNLSSVIQGKSETIRTLTIALLAGGSVLMEDVPGVGKTTLAKALARSLDVEFHRVQFTPDLLPGDILGSSVYNPTDGSFSFRAGPIFCNVLLADEINRASPRTQSALLEAMSERQATIEGKPRPLPEPFIVLATQNPIDYHGTYPLPEAQLDRFLVELNPGYPDPETEVQILFNQVSGHPVDQIKPVLSRDDVLQLQALVREVNVEESVARYMVEIVSTTRTDDRLKLGVSPRGSLMLFRAVQAHALMAGRTFAMPDDVQAMASPVLAHRLIMTSQSRYGTISKREIIQDIVKHTRVPT